MTQSLLPPNATQLERLTAKACAKLTDLPVPLRDLWNPATCPPSLLPYLAWSLAVNYWESHWPDKAKRAVIQSSCITHQRKGTIWALRQALEPLGYTLRITEWWQHTPPDAPGTFRLNIFTKQGIGDDTRRELERLIDEVKPLSRHLIDLSFTFESTGVLKIGLANLTGDDLTVYAYAPEFISSSGTFNCPSAIHIVDDVTCSYPYEQYLTIHSDINFRSALHTIDTVTCFYPYEPYLTIHSDINFQGALHTIDTVTWFYFYDQCITTHSNINYQSALHTIDTLSCAYKRSITIPTDLNWRSALHTIDTLRCSYLPNSRTSSS